MDALDPTLRWVLSSSFYVAAYAFAAGLFWWLAVKRGVATSGFRFVALAGLLGGAIGGIVAQLIVTQDEGRSIVGAYIGGFLAVLLAKRLIGLERHTGDLFAIAIAGGEAVGRIGCLIGGCCFGKITSLPWAIEEHGAMRHPTQIYSSLAAFAALGILFWLERKKLPEDTLLCVQGILFCTARGTIDTFREGAPVASFAGHALPFTVVQLACIAGAIFFARRLRVVAPDLLAVVTQRPVAIPVKST